MAWTNRHTVIPGQVYRCSQPTPSDLAELVRQHGIRTVVNLRGAGLDYPWYQAEARATAELDLSQEDVTLSANRLPAPTELRRLVEVLDHSTGPILIHCKRGADRTGLAAVLARLLLTNDTLAEGRRHLGPTTGHFRFGRTAAMDEFWDRYEAWLTAEQQLHTPDRLRHWIAEVYTPGYRMSQLEWLDAPQGTIAASAPTAVRVRATNRSTEPWELKPGHYAGVHLAWCVAKDPLTAVFRGQAGLQRATVRPGESIEFTIAVPPLLAPGSYVLVAEMTDATGAGVPIRANSFVQFGDAAILTELRVQ
jgi:protein tyrosine phosphatase (PTP) superfamily phosphohydrolase (DUF442 family)